MIGCNLCNKTNNAVDIIYLQHFYCDLGVQHTIGVDQDVWYYSKSQDEPARDECSVHKLITFYTWDFAGQVSSIMYFK